MECIHSLSSLPYFVFICSCKFYNRCNSVSQRKLWSQMNKLKPFRFPSNYLNRCDPVSKILVWLLGSNIIHANDAIGFAKILLGNASVAFLASRIPKRKRNDTIVNHYSLDLKIDTFFPFKQICEHQLLSRSFKQFRQVTDCGAKWLAKCVVAKALYKTGLADARVTNKHYFEYTLRCRVLWHILFLMMTKWLTRKHYFN